MTNSNPPSALAVTVSKSDFFFPADVVMQYLRWWIYVVYRSFNLFKSVRLSLDHEATGSHNICFKYLLDRAEISMQVYLCLSQVSFVIAGPVRTPYARIIGIRDNY